MSSIFNHSWFGDFMGDAATANILSADQALAHMRRVEAAWIAAQADVGTIDADLARRTIVHIETCAIQTSDLTAGVARDGLPVPALVHVLKAAAPQEVQAVIHKGLTSQDVMDTALCLALRDIFDLFDTRLAVLIDALKVCETTFENKSLMGYTRMQAALPISAKTRIETWRRPLENHRSLLRDMKTRLNAVQFGGPVGERGTFEANGTAAAFAKHLDMNDPGFAWHTDRSDLVAFSAQLSHITGSLGKLGQDVVLMAQRGPDDIQLRGGGTSSAMPHKQNPILGELLVTLAHHATTLQPNMSNALIHEQERSGAMWALEWMTLPDIVQCCGRALTAATELVEKIETIGR